MTPDELDFMLHPRFHGYMLKFCEAMQMAFTCSECGSSTFFPHGGEEEGDLRGTRRWLCKQCGYYVGPEGEAQALYDPLVDLTDTPLNTWGCWQLEKDASDLSYLPRDILAEYANDCRYRAGIEE